MERTEASLTILQTTVEKMGSNIEVDAQVGSTVVHLANASGMNTNNLLPLTGGSYSSTAYPQLYEKIGFRFGAYGNFAISTIQATTSSGYQSVSYVAIDPIDKWRYVGGVTTSGMLAVFVYDASNNLVRTSSIWNGTYSFRQLVAYGGCIAAVSYYSELAVSTDKGLTWTRPTSFSFSDYATAVSINKKYVLFFGILNGTVIGAAFNRSTKSFPSSVTRIYSGSQMPMFAVSTNNDISLFAYGGYLRAGENIIGASAVTSLPDSPSMMQCLYASPEGSVLIPTSGTSGTIYKISGTSVSAVSTLNANMQYFAGFSSMSNGILIGKSSDNGDLLFVSNTSPSYSTSVSKNYTVGHYCQFCKISDTSFAIVGLNYSNATAVIAENNIFNFTLPTVTQSNLAWYVRAKLT